MGSSQPPAFKVWGSFKAIQGWIVLGKRRVIKDFSNGVSFTSCANLAELATPPASGWAEAEGSYKTSESCWLWSSNEAEKNLSFLGKICRKVFPALANSDNCAWHFRSMTQQLKPVHGHNLQQRIFKWAHTPSPTAPFVWKYTSRVPHSSEFLKVLEYTVNSEQESSF